MKPMDIPFKNPSVIAADIGDFMKESIANDPYFDSQTKTYMWNGITIPKECASAIKESKLRQNLLDSNAASIISSGTEALLYGSNSAFTVFNTAMHKGVPLTQQVYNTSKNFIANQMHVMSQNQDFMVALKNLNRKLDETYIYSLSTPIREEFRKVTTKTMMTKDRDLEDCEFCSFYSQEDNIKSLEEKDPWCVITFPHKDAHENHKEVCFDVKELWKKIEQAVQFEYPEFKSKVFFEDTNLWVERILNPSLKLQNKLNYIQNPAASFKFQLMDDPYFTPDQIHWIVVWYIGYEQITHDLKTGKISLSHKKELWELGKHIMSHHRKEVDIEQSINFEDLNLKNIDKEMEAQLKQDFKSNKSLIEIIWGGAKKMAFFPFRMFDLAKTGATSMFRYLWKHPIVASIAILIGDIARLFLCGFVMTYITVVQGKNVKAWLASYLYQNIIIKIFNYLTRVMYGQAVFVKTGVSWFIGYVLGTLSYWFNNFTPIGLPLQLAWRAYNVIPSTINYAMGSATFRLSFQLGLLGLTACYPILSPFMPIISSKFGSFWQNIDQYLGLQAYCDDFLKHIGLLIEDEMFTDYWIGYDKPSNLPVQNGGPINPTKIPTVKMGAFNITTFTKIILLLSTEKIWCWKTTGTTRTLCKQSFNLFQKFISTYWMIEMCLGITIDLCVFAMIQKNYTISEIKEQMKFIDYLPFKGGSCACQILSMYTATIVPDGKKNSSGSSISTNNKSSSSSSKPQEAVKSSSINNKLSSSSSTSKPQETVTLTHNYSLRSNFFKKEIHSGDQCDKPIDEITSFLERAYCYKQGKITKNNVYKGMK
jgi:hypothetical protein